MRLIDSIIYDNSAKVVGNSTVDFEGLNLCNRHTEKRRILTYVTSDKYVELVKKNTSIVCIIARDEDANAYKSIIETREGAMIVCNDPEVLFYKLHNQYIQLLHNNKVEVRKAVIGTGCHIHETAVISDGVIIGNNVTIGANTVIQAETQIGNNVEIGCNTTIGSEGFQIIKVRGVPFHIRHVGKVKICDGVYIGDNTDVCNSLFEGFTFIGENTKIDNLVHIAHNCEIGKNCVITAGVILCGSSYLKDGAWIGVNSSVLNKVTIGEGALVGIGSVVTRDIDAGAVAYGVPAKQKETRE